jgi:hypothetical protein
VFFAREKRLSGNSPAADSLWAVVGAGSEGFGRCFLRARRPCARAGSEEAFGGKINV